jgi:hypothetical protein
MLTVSGFWLLASLLITKYLAVLIFGYEVHISVPMIQTNLINQIYNRTNPLNISAQG